MEYSLLGKFSFVLNTVSLNDILLFLAVAISSFHVVWEGRGHLIFLYKQSIKEGLGRLFRMFMFSSTASQVLVCIKITWETY